MVVFDFDQTLSVIHVFKALAGWSKDVQLPRPHATTERGQVRRIAELSQVDPFRSERGGFATAVFGGEARVEQLRQVLERLQAREVELLICTKGLVGAVRKCLHDVDLLGFFSEVYGNVGDNYGETPFDKELARSKPTTQERQFMSPPDKAAWRSKDKLILQLATRAGLSREQAVLVEDDPEEIRRANSVCRTLFVKEAAGMTPKQCAALLQMAEAPSDSQCEDVRVAHRHPRSRGLEARRREASNSANSASRRFEEPRHREVSCSKRPGSANRRLEEELSRLSLDEDRRPRRSTSSVDSVPRCPPRRASRPISRGSGASKGSRSTLQAAGAGMLAGVE